MARTSAEKGHGTKPSHVTLVEVTIAGSHARTAGGEIKFKKRSLKRRVFDLLSNGERIVRESSEGEPSRAHSIVLCRHCEWFESGCLSGRNSGVAQGQRRHDSLRLRGESNISLLFSQCHLCFTSLLHCNGQLLYEEYVVYEKELISAYIPLNGIVLALNLTSINNLFLVYLSISIYSPDPSTFFKYHERSFTKTCSSSAFDT